MQKELLNEMLVFKERAIDSILSWLDSKNMV